MSLRNVGTGIAVCQGWTIRPGPGAPTDHPTHVPLEDLRLQSRDLYVPASDIGMWQGALRNPDDSLRAQIAEAIDAGQPITVELLYTDQIARQRTISRFGLVPTGDSWLASLSRHWYLDWDGPRPESVTFAAVEAVLRDNAAFEERRATTDGQDDQQARDDSPTDSDTHPSQGPE